ncbi:pentatricopeptide repeat-containing protein At5g44230-like [Rutidosis leptorrhynchoides]|uniref:pentatricopeptide repeat-containing protein At5g44230-like n=1 Tax=Rutidosis leptorrhynchoides TaxID=125765 RepID=UPI003A9A19C1
MLTPARKFFAGKTSQQHLLESQLFSKLDHCKNLTHIKSVHAQILRKGIDQCCYVLTKLIRVSTKLCVPVDEYPRSVFDQVRYPNPFLWTSLIRGYTAEGCLKRGVFLYDSMRSEGIGAVSFTFTALLKSCGDVGDVNLGMQLHARIIMDGGFQSDLFVGNTLIDMYVKCGFLECGRQVFDEMPDKDEISWTELIVAYTKSGDIFSAAQLFDESPVKDMVAWTSMVTGFAQNSMPREALNYFERMQNSGMETDEVTLIGVISACAQLGAAKYANWVRDIVEKSRFGPTHAVVLQSALVDMYSKCGCLDDAYNVFQAMTEKNVYSYSSMISGFAMHGRAQSAIKLFDEMVKNDVKPNRVTFIGVLTACSHGGMEEQGRKIFKSMEDDYGVTPSPDHYTCMVDLLGRVGHLNEALELIKKMPVKPHGGVWGALLGACRIHGNPEIAQIAASHLFELEPDSIGNYILMSHIFASAGMWEDASKIRKQMKEKGLIKNPASSMVESDKGVIHEFFSGDTSHPDTDKIKGTLVNLLQRLTMDGYQPMLSSLPYDLSNEEKKQILLTHSEKLALAFGLMNTSSDSNIRIVKNLRICEDCHLFMCGASKVTRRKIIVRDNMRFHHFCNGTCSCGNFW